VRAHGFDDQEADPAGFQGFPGRVMTSVSTLSVFEPRDHRVNTPLLWDVVEPPMRERLDAPRTESGPGNVMQLMQARKIRWRHLLLNVKAMKAAGVRIGVGTDAGMPSAPHGWSTLL